MLRLHLMLEVWKVGTPLHRVVDYQDVGKKISYLVKHATVADPHTDTTIADQIVSTRYSIPHMHSC